MSMMFCICTVPLAALAWGMLPLTSAAEQMAQVSQSNLCVTLGTIERDRGVEFFVSSPKMRAVALGSSGQGALLQFTYFGPTKQAAPLASGELRRQIGLKLHAQDGCNVLYVMWR